MVNPIEIKMDTIFLPNVIKMTNANKIVGNDQNKLIIKDMTWSVFPSNYPANKPSIIPIIKENKTALEPTSNVYLIPIINLL